MESDEASNPYLPPVTQSPPLPEEKGPLADPRLRGWFAAGTILLNSLVFLASAFMPQEWYDQNIPTILLVSTYVAGIIAFLVWFHCCAANAMKMHRGGGVTSPGWAVGCFFIPIVNWVAPCLVMLEVVKSTFRHRPAREMSTVTIIWWISFLIRNVSTRWSETDLNAAWIAIGAVLVAGGTVTYIIARISGTQAAFRWTDVPEYERPVMRAIAPSAPSSGPRPVPEVAVDGRPPMLPNAIPAPRVVKLPAKRLVPPPPARQAAPLSPEPESGEA